MKSSNPIWISLLLHLLLMSQTNAQQVVAADMSRAANNLLATLDDAQREKVQFPFDSDEREDWHYFPKRDRKGLSLKEMQAHQRQLAHLLLNSALSHQGYFQAVTIMTLEQILFEKSNGNPIRDPELYYIAIFGEPGSDLWGWSVEGHHLSLNFTLHNGRVVSGTPAFYGANPAEILDGPRAGLRALAPEEDLARELVTSLTPDQRQIAVIQETAPHEIITGADRKVDPLEPLGIGWEQLTPPQQTLLTRLIRQYLDRHRPELATADWQEIEQVGFPKLHFAWAGSLQPRQGHYYRVQGANFLLEYDNTQDNANHIHTVWRNFQNDFAHDILQEHYEQSPHHE